MRRSVWWWWRGRGCKFGLIFSGVWAGVDAVAGAGLHRGAPHTFSGSADAINAPFARWDLSHLHEFELTDGRRIGFLGRDPFADDETLEDHAAVKVADAVAPGDEFSFVFDFGDRWEHRCRVLDAKADPRQEWGSGPLLRQPVTIWGGGLIPDQYGRRSAADLDLEP